MLAVTALVWASLAACASPDPTTVRAEALQRASEATERNDHAAAVQAYQAALAVDPLDGSVLFELSRSLWAAEQWSAAAREGIRAADLLPDNFDAQLWSVAMMLSQSRFIDAGDRASRLLARRPEDPTLLLLKAHATAQLLNSTWGLWRLDEALRKGIDYQSTRVGLRPDTPGRADAAAESLYRQAVARAPRSLEVRLALVSFLWAVDRAAEAEPMLRAVADEYPGHLLANSALGHYYLRAGNLVDAEKYLKIAEDLGNQDAGWALAGVYASTDRPAEALVRLEQFATDGERATAAALRAADIDRQLGRQDAAKVRLERILAAQPLNPDALQRYAALLLDAGDTQAALRHARLAVETDPGSRAARWTLGKALAETGDNAGAFEQMAEVVRLDPTSAEAAREFARLALALGRHEIAVEFARQAVREDPSGRGARLDLVQALIGRGDLQRAGSELQPLLTGTPDARALWLAGTLEETGGQATAARRYYERALAAAPDSFEVLAALVTLDLRTNRIADARRHVDAAPRHAHQEALMTLDARVSLHEGNHSRSESLLREVLLASPGAVEPTLLLSEVLAAIGRYPEALATLDGALTERPGHPGLQMARAETLERMGRLEDAKAQYRAVVETGNDAPLAAMRLAALYVRNREQLDVALTLATDAKKDLPDNAAASHTLGLVYLARGLESGALPYLREAVRLEPGNASYRYHLGVALEGAGQYTAAREELTRALEIDANFPEALDARTRLAAVGR
jgi:tetratricopeptide (TPR) repeat protein